MTRGRPPEKMWVLIDRANGGCGYEKGARHYLWWFDSRDRAREQKKEHDENPKYAELEGPYRYNLRTASEETMFNLLKELLEYWKEPDTPLPHIDLFDRVARIVEP